jgi:hypothetical protein
MSPRRSRRSNLLSYLVLIGVALFVWYQKPIPGIPRPDTVLPKLKSAATNIPYINQVGTLMPSVPVVGTYLPQATPAPLGTPAAVPSDLAAYLPDPGLTPGDTLPVTTADICVSGYSSKVRDVPQSVKDQVYAEYGITSHAPGSYEVDHLISLEVGGSNSIKNLWPESYSGDWNAHVKDKLENRLHALICDGSLDLATAQHEEATNWIAAYQKYVGQP